MWLCYLLKSNNSNKTYVGATINLIARLEKHNKGKGAKYTKGEQWGVLCYITGFETKQQCLSFEKNFQRMRRYRKKTGYKYTKCTKTNRYLDLFGLVNKQWSRYVPSPSLVPLKINCIQKYVEKEVPQYIEIIYEWCDFMPPFE